MATPLCTGTLLGVYLQAAVFGFTYTCVMACMVVSVNAMVPARVSTRSWSIVAFFGWIGIAWAVIPEACCSTSPADSPLLSRH